MRWKSGEVGEVRGETNEGQTGIRAWCITEIRWVCPMRGTPRQPKKSDAHINEQSTV